MKLKIHLENTSLPPGEYELLLINELKEPAPIHTAVASKFLVRAA